MIRLESKQNTFLDLKKTESQNLGKLKQIIKHIWVPSKWNSRDNSFSYQALWLWVLPLRDVLNLCDLFRSKKLKKVENILTAYISLTLSKIKVSKIRGETEKKRCLTDNLMFATLVPELDQFRNHWRETEMYSDF